VKRVDAHPYRKAHFGEWYYTYATISTFTKRYLVNPPRVSVDVAGRSLEAVTVIVQNADPYTYFGRRSIRICEGTALDNGTLDWVPRCGRRAYAAQRASPRMRLNAR